MSASPEGIAVPQPASDGQTMPVVKILVALAFGVYALVLLRHSWLSDDAYITFRTVDNFVEGRGLTWNPGERVQAYTHPLWMFLTAGVYWVTGEIFYTVHFLSLAVSLAVGIVVLRLHAKIGTAALFALAALTSSKAFVDYSSSGLENPLTHLLFAVTLWHYLERPATRRSLVELSFLAALLLLSRMDMFLLVLPIVVHAAWRLRSWRVFLDLALGLTPFVAWEVFSLIYYGVFFPNTAYAKLGTGIPASESFRQGLFYVLTTADLDPLTLLLIGSGVAASLWSRQRGEMLVAGGILLYVLYVIGIGGDFMAGRYFSAPVLGAIVLLARQTGLPRGSLGLLPSFVVVIVGLFSAYPTLRADGTYKASKGRNNQDLRFVIDERATYYEHTGLLAANRFADEPEHPWALQGRGADDNTVKVLDAVGFAGYFGDTRLRIVDQNGLADPLLSRLPPMWNRRWFIGHFRRTVPKGYEETLKEGGNRLADPELAKYYEHIHRITRGRIFSTKRWRSIWYLNTGQLDYLIKREVYLFPNRVQVKLSAVSPKIDGDANAPGNHRLDARGGMLVVDLEGQKHARFIELAYDRSDDYVIEIRRQGTTEGSLTAEKRPNGKQELIVKTFALPPKVVADGYDEIRIYSNGVDEKYALGRVRLLP